MAEHHVTEHAGNHGGDPDPELAVSAIAKILVAIAVVSLLAATVVWPLVHGFLDASLRRQPPARVDNARPAGPLLQANPEDELRRIRAREDGLLHSYGWVDEGAGVARIPVSRAAELVLEEGLELGSSAAGMTEPGASDPAGVTTGPEAEADEGDGR